MPDDTPLHSDIFSWAAEEEVEALRDVLGEPFVALGVYRWISEEARTVVLYMLTYTAGEPFTELARRVFLHNAPEMVTPKRIGVFVPIGDGLWGLSTPFQHALQEALAYDGQYKPKKRTLASDDVGTIIGTEDGVSQWEGFLRLLLELPKQSLQPHKISLDVLKRGQFVNTANEKTAAGFQLLIQPLQEQVWRVLQVQIDLMSAILSDQGADLPAFKRNLLIFLFALPFHDTEQYYTFRNGAAVMQNFVHFGIIALKEGENQTRRYKVTPVGVALASPPRSVARNTAGALIVETNNRIYAYTNDAFKVGMLRLFAEVELQTSGMTVARMTRATLTKAFERNMTSDQIISYLKNNAHPNMRALPVTVVDMIELWEAEMRRASFTKGVLLSGPETHVAQLHRMAMSLHPSDVLYSSPGKLVVTPRLDKLLSNQ